MSILWCAAVGDFDHTGAEDDQHFRIRRSTTGGKLGLTFKAATYARFRDRRGEAVHGGRWSVVISFCGSLLPALLVSFVLPTDASFAYLQLWMGTYLTLPSKLLQGGGETLVERLRKSPELLDNRGLGGLPFLFKVLAIRKAF
jgi:hypothetical protein